MALNIPPGLPTPGGAPPIPQGAVPPTMAAPVSAPHPQAGNSAAAMTQIAAALKQMEVALPSLPMGTPLHTEILNTIKQVSKHLAKHGEESQGMQMQAMINTIKQMAQQGPQSALARMAGPQAGASSIPAAA